MATDQDSIKVYLPRDESAKFRKLADASGQTIAGRIRVLVREDLAANEEKLEAAEAAA